MKVRDYVNDMVQGQKWAVKVDLSCCSVFFVEKKYIKHNGRIVDGVIERTSVPLNVFKNSIVLNRRSNL